MNRKFLKFFFIVLFTLSFITGPMSVKADTISGFFTNDSFFVIYDSGASSPSSGSLNIAHSIVQNSYQLRTNNFRIFGSGNIDNVSLVITATSLNGTLNYNIFNHTIHRGINPQGNPYYYDAGFSLQTTTSQNEKINIKMTDLSTNQTILNFFFLHKTNDLLIPTTVTGFDIFYNVMLAFAFGLIVSVVAIVLDIGTLRKGIHIPFPPLKVILLTIIASLMAFIGILLYDLNFDFQLITVVFIKNVALYIVTPTFLLAYFAFGNYLETRMKFLKEKLIFVLKIDYEHNTLRKLLKNVKVLEHNGKMYHVHDENDLTALKEFMFSIFGWRKEYVNYKSIQIDDIDDYESDFDDLILSTNYKENDGVLVAGKILDWRLYLLPVLSILLFALTGYLDYLGMLGFLRSVFYSIVVIFFCISFLIFYLYARTNYTNPSIELDPIVDPEVMSLMLKVDVVKRLKKIIRKLYTNTTIAELNPDLEYLVEIQSNISGADPDAIKKWLVDIEENEEIESIEIVEPDDSVYKDYQNNLFKKPAGTS